MPSRNYVGPPGSEPVTRAAERRPGPIEAENRNRRLVDLPSRPGARSILSGQIVGTIFAALLCGLMAAGLGWWAANLF